MRDRNASACFSTPILLASGRSPLDRDRVLEFIDSLDVKLVAWQRKFMLDLLCGPDPWELLWRNVFEWLPWPLFALQHFTETDYYHGYL